MNLVAKYKLNQFINNELDDMFRSKCRKPNVMVQLLNGNIIELHDPNRVTRYFSGPMHKPALSKVMSVHEIKKIEYDSNDIFITKRNGRVIHIFENGAFEANKKFYKRALNNGLNSVL